ncbi:MAG: S-layer homology domain-containing protein [Micrococcus sp.]|nr:S-layer homology domain-containing protein [Micrococcus sp.]
MTSTRRLSGAVAIGLSVALTGAFAAPSFAAPAEGAKLDSSTYTTTTVEGKTYAQETRVYSDGTVIVFVFENKADDRVYNESVDTLVSKTETSTDGTKTVTDAKGVVTVTAPNGTVTQVVKAGPKEVKTVLATDGTVTETISVELKNVTLSEALAAAGPDFQAALAAAAKTGQVKLPVETDEKGNLKVVVETKWDSKEKRAADANAANFTAYDDFSNQQVTGTFITTKSSHKVATKTAADGTETTTVTETTTETTHEVVAKTAADGTTTLNSRVYDKSSDTVTEIVTKAGADGKVGTADDIVTVTVTKADGTVTETVYEPGAKVTIKDGVVTVEGAIDSKRDVTPTNPGDDDENDDDENDDDENDDDENEDDEDEDDEDEDDEDEDDEDEDDVLTFSDNPEGSAFYNAVQWMADEGISVGYADGTFKKNAQVSRAHTASFLYNFEDADFDAPEESPFSDVNAGGAFFTPITWAADEKITVGFADGTFKPSKSVTRAQFAAFLYGLEDPDFTAPTTSPFGDINVGGAHYDAITWLEAEEISVGDTQDNFNPSAPITRAQMAQLLMKFDATVN